MKMESNFGGGMQMTDYSITWGYIVERMKTRYGIRVDSTERFSMGEIEAYLEDIWSEFVDMIDKT